MSSSLVKAEVCLVCLYFNLDFNIMLMYTTSYLFVNLGVNPALQH